MNEYAKPVIRLSVRSFVDFVLREGDLSSEFQGSSRIADGIRYHQALQKSNIESCPENAIYTPEVTVRYEAERDDVRLEISGRIDGILEQDGAVTIEEIKTTDKDLDAVAIEQNQVYWAQAKCYAFMYCTQQGLESLTVRLTYFQITAKHVKSFSRPFSIAELKEFFDFLVSRHLAWAKTLQTWNEERDASIKAMEFPFSAYRKGQRELAVAVYRTIRDGRHMFAQAPTGTGKTAAVLFPAIKSLGEGHTDKIFYLTAKTITRSVAENALAAMKQNGLRLKTLSLTAKDKICFNPGAECTPDECIYAKGYYDRINDALGDIFSCDTFTRPVIEEYALRHRVCPFEFSLDLSLWSDCIVCDYNYVFDPRVYLKRFFSEEGENAGPGRYTFLIDEAHNLADRAREMFSSELRKEDFAALKRLAGKRRPAAPAPGRMKKLITALRQVHAFLAAVQKKCAPAAYDRDTLHCVGKQAPDALYPHLREFLKAGETLLMRDEQYPFREQLLERYFEAFGFLRTAEYFDERYACIFTRRDKEFIVRLFCVDPSYLLRATLRRGTAAVFFSATLAPLNYFMQVLGGEENPVQMKLASPFPRRNLRVLLDDSVSTRYRERALTYGRIAASITAAVSAKTGNYIVYFPSYKYLRAVSDVFIAENPALKVIIQKEGMTEQEREVFLHAFSSFGSETLVGFAVLGGVFGEGIDLVGERLSGVVVVGVGLPQICLERDLIRDYFRDMAGAGFEFAYAYPGMNKVLQAVGRVIRSETDRGIILLIDERFAGKPYAPLFPPEWNPVHCVRTPQAIGTAVSMFWNSVDDKIPGLADV